MFIESSGDITSSEILARCSLSRKTLVSEIQAIAVYLKNYGAEIISLKGKGYRLRIENITQYQAFCDEFLYRSYRREHLQVSKNHLVYLIMFEIITNEGYIKIDDLSKAFNYSQGVVSKSLHVARGYFAQFGCAVVSKPHYGMKLESTEWQRRICLIYIDKIVKQGTYIFDQKYIEIFSQLFDKNLYSMSVIGHHVQFVLEEYGIVIPYGNLVKLNFYILLAQSRKDVPMDIPEYVGWLAGTMYQQAGNNITEHIRRHGLYLSDADSWLITTLIAAYATVQTPDELPPAMLEECREDTSDLIEYLEGLYSGVKEYFDEVFVSQCICHLAELKIRRRLQLTDDTESTYTTKHEGLFMAEMCLDFAVFYHQKYTIRLPETEALRLYFLFSNAGLRKRELRARYRAVVMSRHGQEVSQNIAYRLQQDQRLGIVLAHAIEYADLTKFRWEASDILFTDINLSDKELPNIPILKLDFSRLPNLSPSFYRFSIEQMASAISPLIRDKNMLRNKNFKERGEVFQFLAQQYVPEPSRAAFIADCEYNNAFISDERRNKLAIVSTSTEYYQSEEIVIIFNRLAFLWDKENVQTIIFLSRRGRPYANMKICNKILSSLIHTGTTNLLGLSMMNADEIIHSIAKDLNKFK